jgi:hypothetical protein
LESRRNLDQSWKGALMRNFLTLTILLLSALAQAKDINLDEPPYILMSHFEVSEIGNTQREQYLGHLIKDFKRLKGEKTKLSEIGKLDLSGLKSALKDETQWRDLMIQVYKACDLQKNDSVCDSLERVRVDAFERKGRKPLSTE